MKHKQDRGNTVCEVLGFVDINDVKHVYIVRGVIACPIGPCSSQLSSAQMSSTEDHLDNRVVGPIRSCDVNDLEPRVDRRKQIRPVSPAAFFAVKSHLHSQVRTPKFALINIPTYVSPHVERGGTLETGSPEAVFAYLCIWSLIWFLSLNSGRTTSESQSLLPGLSAGSRFSRIFAAYWSLQSWKI